MTKNEKYNLIFYSALFFVPVAYALASGGKKSKPSSSIPLNPCRTECGAKLQRGEITQVEYDACVAQCPD